SLNAGCTCPTRDGSIDTRGCIFCSAKGSGDFAESNNESISVQIENAKRRVSSKMPALNRSNSTSNNSQNKDSQNNAHKYIAYFQPFTNTYGDPKVLEQKYLEAANHPDIVGLSIATRPDCLSEEILDIICTINRTCPVWIELGLQTVHEDSAKYIRRGFGLDVYDKAVSMLSQRELNIITHVILGLPGEDKDMMLETVDYVGRMSKRYDNITHGIKLQLLHVLKGTDLEKDYNAGKFNTLTPEEYIEIVRQALMILPPEVIIHRLTGDGDKKLLVAPKWSANKKLVINELQKIYDVV
ncbi:MAG: TIGR01212 family radical SAM protein, partial [Lachnospiraceae bacterium]|nr:TIGR01212 family radical SAM protein [Lachnospiraceae bacterium]